MTPSERDVAPTIDVAEYRALACAPESRVVVVRGPADVVDPLVAEWIAAHQDGFDVVLTVDPNYFRHPSGVDHKAVLRYLTRQLGGWVWRLPMTTPRWIARYRAAACERTILVHLMNADSAPQVRAVMPGNLSSLVLVTSRRMLGGLVTERAQYVDLGDGATA